jgi:hypothetical protein
MQNSLNGLMNKKFKVFKINPAPIPLENETPPAFLPETVYINVRGRKEHEELLKDADKCKELGLDQYYETMVYLHRWGEWLDEKQS